jgi:hypothetical protein
LTRSLIWTRDSIKGFGFSQSQRWAEEHGRVAVEEEKKSAEEEERRGEARRGEEAGRQGRPARTQ